MECSIFKATKSRDRLNLSLMNYLSRFIFLLIFAGLILQTPASAQNTDDANSAPTIFSPVVAPTPIPFSDVIGQSEQARSAVQEIASKTAANSTADAVERGLPAVADEITARLAQPAQLTAGRPSFENLRRTENDWRALGKNLPQWKNDLTDRARKLEASLAQLNDLEKTWQLTQSEAANGEAVPVEVATRIQNILTAVADVRRQIGVQQARIVGLQDKVDEQQKRVDGALNGIGEARTALVGQLLVQDNPPLWNRALWTQAPADVWRAAVASLTGQLVVLTDFANRNIISIIIHLLVFIGFAGSLIFLRQRAQLWVEKEPELKNAAVIFYLPISTALVLAILVSSPIYPPIPQILRTIFGAVALLPTIIILRKLVERSLYPILYSLVVFYFIDLLRTVSDSQEIIWRLLFPAEMLGGFLFFLWLRRARLSENLNDKSRQNNVFRTFRFVIYLVLPIFALAFLANIFGYVSFSQLLGSAVLRSSYAALIIYAIVRIIDGLIIFALRFRPLSLLKMVRKHRALIQKRLRKLLRWIAFGGWVLITLELLSLRDPLFQEIKAILNARLNVGSLSISLGDVLAFAVTVWATFLLSRLVRFALEEDVYPRVPLERGLPYAISTLLNYTILLFGFFLAVAAAGFDLTKFTILAGAFGVGIGFGLQNIISNFVSGLILLFERPIKVGDFVKIGDSTGTVRSIGIRASIVHVWDNSDVIVPNSKLISENVVNWTFSTQQRGIEIIFSVPPATAPKQVIEIMEKAAENHPLIGENPLPQVLFEEISFDRLIFKLRVWTDYFDKVLKIRSDLILAISEALKAENIPHEKIGSETAPI